MKKFNLLFCGILTLGVTTIPVCSCKAPKITGIINVADYCDSKGRRDCADDIQYLIDHNPNSTLWFGDGTYLLSHPIKTYSEPTKSVDLRLSNFAVLKAMNGYKVHRDITEDWMDSNNYMVQLGVDRKNQQDKVGNNYSFTGGVIDGSGFAPAIEISGGRETVIQNCNIKNAQIGIRVAKGVNGGGSADADIRNLSITCNNDADSIGLQVDAYDNTCTNIRIGHCNKGLKVNTTGNTFINFHMLCNQSVEKYAETSVGVETKHGNWYSNIYTDNFRTAYKLNGRCTFTDCIAWWFSDEPSSHPFNTTAIDCTTAKFESYFLNFTCGFKPVSSGEKNILLNLEQETTPEESAGRIQNTYIWGKDTLDPNDLYMNYHEGIDVEY